VACSGNFDSYQSPAKNAEKKKDPGYSTQLLPQDKTFRNTGGI
jgi:hypothetical protein